MFRVWASKHMSHFCGVGQIQKICGFWDHSKYPQCQQVHERTTHILVCSGNGARQEWTSWVTYLGLWLIKVDTHLSIQTCILGSLMDGSMTTSFITHAEPFCHPAAEEGKMKSAGRILSRARSHNHGEICN